MSRGENDLNALTLRALSSLQDKKNTVHRDRVFRIEMTRTKINGKRGALDKQEMKLDAGMIAIVCLMLLR